MIDDRTLKARAIAWGLYVLVALSMLVLTVLCLTGCQAAQSPTVPTQKNPNIYIIGDNNVVNMKWKTDIWLEGGQKTEQKQDIKPEVTIPLR
ncbi:hypothetical protein LCGC14_0391890 [marine sediment metagenome]|uniref:Uncharacterized protein n=1 Tax=marine sediment metagenome TaxID=412755 RepID=A0A0F9SZ58_9ZZZZ